MVKILRKLEFRGYGWRGLAGDCFGGMTAALIALPYGLALASMMGLPPVLGIFTSIFSAPITALLGRNPVLIGGTGSVTVPFIAIAVRQQGIGGAAKVSIVAAVIMMAFCVMRLGRHIKKVPHAVISGFSCGIGIVMLISQRSVIEGISSFLLGLTVIVAATVSTLYSPRIPAPFIGVGSAILLAKLLGLHEKEVGTVMLAMPLFAGFSWSPEDVSTVLPSGLALALVTSVNLLITSRVVEHFRGRHKHMKMADADAELGAYGIANVCAGMFGVPLSVGIPARSLANLRCGATTRFSNLMHALFLLLLLRFGSGFLSQIPVAALAGVTAWMGLCLLDWSTWRRLPKMRRLDTAAFIATALAVLAVNAAAAVAIGCLLFGGHYLYGRLSRSLPEFMSYRISPKDDLSGRVLRRLEP